LKDFHEDRRLDVAIPSVPDAVGYSGVHEGQNGSHIQAVVDIQIYLGRQAERGRQGFQKHSNNGESFKLIMPDNVMPTMPDEECPRPGS
jgi:hypothetical protein